MSWLLDVLVFALLILGMILGVKRGFVRTVIELLGIVAMLVIATTVAQPVAETVYDSTLRPSVEESVTATLTDTEQTGEALRLDATFDALPGVVQKLLTANGITPDSVRQSLSEKAESSSDTVAKRVADTLAVPIEEAIRLLFVAILFVIGMVVIRLLAGTCNSVAKRLPVIGTVNALLGGLTGLLRGAVWALVAANLLYLLLSLRPQGLFGLTAEQARQTQLFSHLCLLLQSK